MGYRHTEEAKKRISLGKMGKLNPAKRADVRKKISEAQKARFSNPEIAKKYSLARKKWTGDRNPFYGRHHSEKSKERIANRFYPTGKEHHWFKPDRKRQYSLEWKNTLKRAIRERDNYKCQYCGIPQEECLRQLDVHHKDGDKLNCNPVNLISLCISCHSKIKSNHRLNKNRVNCGDSRTDNPQPSLEIANRLKEGSETKAEETIMPISALGEQDVRQEIVRYFEESEKQTAMVITQHHKEV